MYRTFINLVIGAFAGGLSGYIIENYNQTPWKIFAFLWAAPILLFVPIYVSYYKGEKYISDFLYHALLGASLSLFLVLLTLVLLKINVIMALLVNFIISIVAVKVYFEYKLYK